MTMQEFIKMYLESIDAHILAICDNCELDDDEREDWILNDEALYNWAQEEGVDV